MMIVLQIALASLAAGIESRWQSRKVVRLSYAGMLAFAAIFVLNLIAYKGDDYRKYSFLSSYTGQYELVLSDLETSLSIPAFGGKVIANSRPSQFVTDYAARQRDVKFFFTEEANNGDRMEIIRKYRPDYLLLNKSSLEKSPALYSSLAQFGAMIYSDRNFLLLSLKNAE